MTEPEHLGAIWIEPSPAGVDALSLHPDPLLANLLARRGIRGRAEAVAFLEDRPQPNPAPSRLPNLTAAVDRIEAALDAGENIGVFGDYDVDGITSTVLLVSSLRAMTAPAERVAVRLPLRADGYGLTIAAVEAFAAAGVTLLIAVDCGSNDHAAIDRARELECDVLVFDHHQISGTAPDGAVVVSAQLGDDHDLQTLSAVGVVYLAVCELSRRGRPLPPGGDVALLDLVALGAIGDVVPLLGVNRPLVRDGLEWIRNGARAGIRALVRKAGLQPETITSESLSFKVVPRINAAGRVADPKLAFDLLMATSDRVANDLANQIEQLNERRRDESKAILDDVMTMVAADAACLDDPLLVFASDRWSVGLAGPAAAKLSERYRRPVVVLAVEGEFLHGSARSVPGFDVARAFERLDGMLTRHGGHAQAAGLTLRRDRLEEFRLGLMALIAAPSEDLSRAVFQIEADLIPNRLDLKTARALESLQPFGQKNPRPLLRVRNLTVQRVEAMGQDCTHLRLFLTSGQTSVKAVMFGAAPRQSELALGGRIDVLALASLDHWNGSERIDVQIKDFRPSAG